MQVCLPFAISESLRNDKTSKDCVEDAGIFVVSPLHVTRTYRNVDWKEYI